MRRCLSVVALTAALGLLAACSRRRRHGPLRGQGSTCGSGADSGSDADSGSGLSGLSGSDLGTTSNDRPSPPPSYDYATWVRSQATGLRVDAKKFTDAVRAGDVAEAKKQYAPSRTGGR